MSDTPSFSVLDPLYGGAFTTTDPALTLPFVLPGERVQHAPSPTTAKRTHQTATVLTPSPHRTTPLCPHFTVCGGCHYQHATYPAQLDLKQDILQNTLLAAQIDPRPEIQLHASPEPYGYRNRIRLRIHRDRTPDGNGLFRFGYNIRASTEFLPITTCPISAPILIQTAEALLALAAEDKDAAHWLAATAELELFTNDNLSRVQLTLFVAPRTKAPQGSFTRMMNTLQHRCLAVVGASAAAFDPRTGPTGRTLAEHGATGLNYKVGDETYWVSRGGFFQVNRFLIATLVDLVTLHYGEPRSGTIAWDLFAGVGLFSRILTRSFTQVTAVEAAPSAAADLAAAFKKLGSQHRAVAETTLAFLQKALTQRERPDLIVLDPPRAGAGLEACELLARLAPAHIVYVSCDPTTLARDLSVLQKTYTITELHLIDLFPQTFHIETVAVLQRRL